VAYNSFKDSQATRARLARPQIEAMLCGVVRDEAIYIQVREHLAPGTFSQVGEAHFELLLESLYDLIDEGRYKPAEVPHPAMAMQIQHKLTYEGFSVEDRLEDEIFGTDDDPGLLHWIYSYPAEDINRDFILDLVRGFLMERTINAEIRDLVGDDPDEVRLGIEDKLAEFVVKTEIIKSVGVSHSYEFMPEVYQATPIVRFPTGASWIDNRLGGHACGDVNGVIGVFGGGKTTTGTMLTVNAADYFRSRVLEDPGSRPKVAVFLTYEEHPARDVRPRLFCAAASIWKETVEEMTSFDDLSRTGNLRDYERKWWDEQGVTDPALRLGERERLQAAASRLNAHIRIEDMRAPGRGGGGVPEIVGRLESLRQTKQVDIGLVVIDYVNAMARRRLKHTGAELDKKMRAEVVGLPEDIKQQVAERYGCPVWLLQQYNAEANKKSAGAKMHIADSAESRMFGENLAFCIGIGVFDPDTKVGQAHFVKARRRGVQGTSCFIQLIGELGQIRDVDDDYVVSGNRIIARRDASMIQGALPAAAARRPTADASIFGGF